MSIAEPNRGASTSIRSAALAAAPQASPAQLMGKGHLILLTLLLAASAIISACSPASLQQPVASSAAPNHAESRDPQPMDIMERAAKAASNGRSDLALRDYLWALDHGVDVDRAFIGVRNSELIDRIIALETTEPSVMVELESRATRLEQLIVSSGAADVSLYVALNRQRHQRDRTLRLYHQLRTQGSPVADDLYREDVFELLVEQRKYAEIVDRQDWWAESLGFKEWMITNAVRMFRAHAADVFESLAGTNRNQEALALLARVEAVDSSAESYVTFMKRALRAGNKELALLVLRQGRERASPENRPSLTQGAGELGLE
jgi:hypothetical protein